MKSHVVIALIVTVVIIALVAFFISRYLAHPQLAECCSTLSSALTSRSETIYNAAIASGGFKLSYKLSFMNVSNEPNYLGNYSFKAETNGFNMSLYSLNYILPNVERIQHVNSSFNGVELSQCITQHYVNTTAVNSTLMSAIDKLNTNSKVNCSVPVPAPSGIDSFDVAYFFNTFPSLMFTPIDISTGYYVSPQRIYTNGTITSLGNRDYAGQSCGLYAVNIKAYPENINFTECISNRVGLPISVIAKSGNQTLLSTNISSLQMLNNS